MTFCVHTILLGCMQLLVKMATKKISLKQLGLFALILDEEEMNMINTKKIREWVHRCQRKRKSKGEVCTCTRTAQW